MLRKICINKMLSSATLDSNSFSALRRQETRRTVRYLADRARAGLAINVGEQIFVTILNVRERVGAEFLELITEIIDVVGKPNVSDFYPVLSRFDLQGLAKRVRRSAQRMDRMFDRIISQRVGMDKGSKGNGGDFLMVLLNAKDEDENMSMNHVKALLMVIELLIILLILLHDIIGLSELIPTPFCIILSTLN
ncbi:putative licodione synthase [Arabidopsis thaliana]